MGSDVYAVVSPLGGEARTEVLAIWDILETRFGVREARGAQHPHLTYLVGEGTDPQALAARLAATADATAPLTIVLDGLGMFPGPRPVLFMRVVRSAELLAAYERVASAGRSGGLTLWPHYTVQTWVPHVTLALRDLPPPDVPLILAELGRRRQRFLASIGDVRLVRVEQPLSASEYIGTFPLGRSAA